MHLHDRRSEARTKSFAESRKGFAEDPLFRSKFRADTGYGASFSHWVKQQTSLRLRGLLYRAAGAGEYWIFLEDLAPMTHMLTRIVKELMINQETPIYSIAPGWTYRELGSCRSALLERPAEVARRSLVPVPPRMSFSNGRSRDSGCRQFDLDGFREDILEFSGIAPARFFECARLLRAGIITSTGASRRSCCTWTI